jgi:hypothetical protein
VRAGAKTIATAGSLSDIDVVPFSSGESLIDAMQKKTIDVAIISPIQLRTSPRARDTVFFSGSRTLPRARTADRAVLELLFAADRLGAGRAPRHFCSVAFEAFFELRV